MSTESAPVRSTTGVPLTLALLGLTVAIFFCAQIGAVGQQTKAINWQMSNGEKQMTNLKTNKEQLKKLIEEQSKVVERADAVQANFQKIFEELLDLAKDDADARLVVEKWKIQRSAPPKEAAPAEKPAEKKP